MMNEIVTVTTGARLHFGLVVRGESGRRRYGGVGLMVDQPGFRVSVREAKTDRINASPDTTQRVERFLDQMRDIQGGPSWEITVSEEILAHSGLGSGTQLGLALAKAIHRLLGEDTCSTNELSRRTGRGQRSLIGTIGFETGGLIVDGGKPAGSDFAVATTRYDFPTAWRAVLVTPPDDIGLSGERESQAFNDSPSMSPETLNELCLLICTMMLPAIADEDFRSFSAAISAFGKKVGDYFAPLQGGAIANPRMAALADKLRADGVEGVGQTSWGPTLFALCENESTATSVAAEISRSQTWSDCMVRVVAAKNDGAQTSGPS